MEYYPLKDITTNQYWKLKVTNGVLCLEENSQSESKTNPILKDTDGTTWWELVVDDGRLALRDTSSQTSTEFYLRDSVSDICWQVIVENGVISITSVGQMKDYLDFSVPDYNYYLPVEPQEVMVERGEPWQEILLGSGFDEKRINLGDVKFYVTLKWPTLTESESNSLFSFYLAVLKSKTFRWQNPKDGYDYVVRFDTGMKRPISAGGLYSIEPVRLRVLKAIVTKGFGHGKFGQGKFGQG